MTDPPAKERHSELDSETGLSGIAEKLRDALARSADPEGAELPAVQVLLRAREEIPDELERAWKDVPESLCRVLAFLGGAAPFLLNLLLIHPDWLVRLAREDIFVPRTAADYERGLRAMLDQATAEELPQALRRLKYYELARLTLRDLDPTADPDKRIVEVLREISHLADALLERALDFAREEIAKKYGPPRWADAGGKECTLNFCVLGLGKLGSEELNYSSDVDLVYIHANAPEGVQLVREGARLEVADYFARLAQCFGKIVSEKDANGFLYRVDLDLRPEGSSGPLVVSQAALANYYELYAATWERAAFMKARPVAGDKTLGWRVIREIGPMLYRSTMDFAGVAAIREMKARVEDRKAPDEGEGLDIKISKGGIRDVEFVSQALQLLHGGRIPQVRMRSTQGGLEELAEVGVLPKPAAAELLAAYRFYRRVENRIQMVAERQIHRLPQTPAEKLRLARAMGFSGENAVAAFESELAACRERVQRHVRLLLGEEGGEQVLNLFVQSAPQLLKSPGTRRTLELLSEQFARELAESTDKERALNNLSRFIRGVGGRSFFYGLLLDRPELVSRLVRLFAASDYLSDYMAAHPRLIAQVFEDPTVLLLSREQLEADLQAIQDELLRGRDPGDTEARLDALRQFRNKQIVNVGLLDLDDKVALAETEAALTEVAEVCIDGALALAKRQLGPKADRGEFLVVGMGKLAAEEISYGSDLDVIFFFAPATEEEAYEAQDRFVRLAQKFIWAISTRTASGACYEIDARLRPSGRQGMLVSTLQAFRRYHEKSAQVWERQALLRARPVAGSEALARSFEEVRREILLRPLPENAAHEIHHVRERMERELAKERGGHYDFKIGRGGLLDVENAIQYLQLLGASKYPELLVPAPADRILNRLHALGFIDDESFGAFSDGWRFLKRLSARLRVVEDRSISDLDEERGDLDALAKRLGYAEAAGGRTATSRQSARRALLRDYRKHTDAIRRAYLKIMGLP